MTAPESAKVEPAVLDAVAERLDFFLSDANLRQDKFLRKIMMSDDGQYPHQVTPDILLRFNTIKNHTSDPEVVLAAAKTIDRLELSSDGKAIGLKDKFTSEKMDGNVPLSLVVNKLPVREDGKSYDITSDEVRELFTSYGKVTLVKMRYNYPRGDGKGGERPKRVPSGAAFVEFETKEEQEKASADTLTTRAGETIEPKRKIELKGNTLEVMTLEEHLADLRAERKKEKESGEGHGKKRDEPGSPSSKGEASSNAFTFDWKPGCVIRLEGLSADSCDREGLLDALASGLGISVADVRERKIYVDYSRGQEKGALRFPEPSDDIKTLCDKINAGDIKVKDKKVGTARMLEGDEESTYWKDFIDFKTKQMQMRGSGRDGNRNRHNKRSRRH